MRSLCLGVLVISLAACGQVQPIQAASAVNTGVIQISQAATYAWSISGNCLAGPSGPTFRLVSDSGQTDYLAGNGGNVYLSMGNWTGEAGYYSPGGGFANPRGALQGGPTAAPTFEVTACDWTLLLTPNGS